jgi:hypothetical protein
MVAENRRYPAFVMGATREALEHDKQFGGLRITPEQARREIDSLCSIRRKRNEAPRMEIKPAMAKLREARRPDRTPPFFIAVCRI